MFFPKQGEQHPASSCAWLFRSDRPMSSLSQSHQLIGTEREDTKHQVSHHLSVSLDPDGVAAELVLEPSVGALGCGAFVVTARLGLIELDLLSTAWVVIDQRYMTQSAAVFALLGAAIGRIHQVVEIGHSGCAHQRQRNPRPAVMHRCTAEQRRDRHTAVGGVQVQLVAVPGDLVALGVAFGAPITLSGKFRNHLGKALAALPTDDGFLWRTHFAAPGTAALSWRRRFLSKHVFSRQQRLLRCGCLHQGPICRTHRALARLDGGAIPADMSDQGLPEMFLDEGFMHAFGQAVWGKFAEGAREGGFSGQFLPERKAPNAPQRPIDPQPFDQRRRSHQTQYGLGHKGIGQGATIMPRTSNTMPRGNKLLDAHPFQRVDEFLQLRRKRTNFGRKFRHQFVLNYTPALHDPFALCSMHFAGSSDDDFDNRIMPEMAARTSPFAPPAAKIPLGLIVLQEAHLLY